MSNDDTAETLVRDLPQRDRGEALRRINAAQQQGWVDFALWSERMPRLSDIAGINPNTGRFSFLDRHGFHRNPSTFRLLSRPDRASLKRRLYDELQVKMAAALALELT